MIFTKLLTAVFMATILSSPITSGYDIVFEEIGYMASALTYIHAQLALDINPMINQVEDIQTLLTTMSTEMQDQPTINDMIKEITTIRKDILNIWSSLTNLLEIKEYLPTINTQQTVKPHQ